ncbi:hypothetical protein TFLX_04928 [Thermoflexales bacterium]|nr:hypothetical protein TFLX_04928 [Thermoflexales bacterium]
MSDKHTLIQKRLHDEGEKLLTVFEGLTPEQWQTVIYTDGMTWTIKDLLAHQIAAEGEFQFYGRDVLNGGEGAPEGFDINAFNNREVAGKADRTAAQLLADFRATRQATIDFVATIRDDQFAWQGRHPFFGIMVIEDMFKLIYRHNMMHARDIRKALGTG